PALLRAGPVPTASGGRKRPRRRRPPPISAGSAARTRQDPPISTDTPSSSSRPPTGPAALRGPGPGRPRSPGPPPRPTPATPGTACGPELERPLRPSPLPSSLRDAFGDQRVDQLGPAFGVVRADDELPPGIQPQDQALTAAQHDRGERGQDPVPPAAGLQGVAVLRPGVLDPLQRDAATR